MKNKLGYALVVGVFAAGCGGGDGVRASQQQFETVQEGSAAGVTTTIQGPGETLPPITGTNADTTTAFTLDPTVASSTAVDPGYPATTPPAASDATAWPPPLTATSTPTPRPSRPAAPPAPSRPAPPRSQPDEDRDEEPPTTTQPPTNTAPPTSTATPPETPQPPPTNTDTEGTEPPPPPPSEDGDPDGEMQPEPH